MPLGGFVQWVPPRRDLSFTTDDYEARSPSLAGFHGPLWQFLDRELERAMKRDLPIREACDSWYSGAYLLETVASVLYIPMRHASDPEEAILCAVNETMDADTVGAIVGAAVGALHGTDELPRRWVENLSGRTAGDDDGRMFELLDRARQLWATAR